MATVSFKVSDDEAALIRSRARREGISASEHLRRRARLPAPGPHRPRFVRCPHTGTMVFAAPADQPPLTTEAVRGLLADFP